MTKVSRFSLAIALAGTLAACGAQNDNETNQTAGGEETNLAAEVSSPPADAENPVNESVNQAAAESEAKSPEQKKAEPAAADRPKPVATTNSKPAATAPKPAPKTANPEPKAEAAPSTPVCAPEHRAMGHC